MARIVLPESICGVVECEGVKVTVGNHVGKFVMVGSDHAGFECKEKIIIPYLRALLGYYGHKERVPDVYFNNAGCFSPDSCDYIDYALGAAKRAVYNGGAAILICGSGVGMAMAANKVNGAYAGIAYDVESAIAIREHNNTNILCLGSRCTDNHLIEDIVYAWLTAEFTGGEDGRHLRRVAKLLKSESCQHSVSTY